MADRLFVAVWPDAAARRALRETLDSARAELPGIRWQAEERWHLTLAFLGAADAGQARTRLERMQLPVAEPIRLRGAGTFGPIVWIGVEHGTWLADFAHSIQRVLHVADRRFRAHVTVGRARGAAAAPEARWARDVLRSHSGPPWAPDEITLVESFTGPQPRYAVRGRWRLAQLATADPPGLAPPGHAARPSGTGSTTGNVDPTRHLGGAR